MMEQYVVFLKSNYKVLIEASSWETSNSGIWFYDANGSENAYFLWDGIIGFARRYTKGECIVDEKMDQMQG